MTWSANASPSEVGRRVYGGTWDGLGMLPWSGGVGASQRGRDPALQVSMVVTRRCAETHFTTVWQASRDTRGREHLTGSTERSS